ncbi:MAG TPA: hypothetical protein PKD24_08920 [Pyrinomonadaceae bacterium]|nr:hypothetical protein [Pyrinomonadaceae bacterium]HMP65810.1 hypothetical protein [Pyrinomonadaceae bacterium]
MSEPDRWRLWQLRTAILVPLILVLLAASGCGPNPRIMNSVEEKSGEPRAERPKLSPFEADVESMRTADFTYVFVLRRKDGEEMTAEDRSFVNANTPVETNRRKVSDEGRAIILGSNFEFEEKVLAELKARFDLTDLSKPNPKAEKEEQGEEQ